MKKTYCVLLIVSSGLVQYCFPLYATQLFVNPFNEYNSPATSLWCEIQNTFYLLFLGVCMCFDALNKKWLLVLLFLQNKSKAKLCSQTTY